MSGTQRVVLVVVAAVIAVGAFLVLRPDDEDEPETTRQPATQPADTAPQQTAPEARPREPEIPTVRVRGGRPVGGVQTIEAERDETVRFRVRSDEAHEIHLHGYDIAKDATPSKPVEFRFKADETGIFEIELEDTGTQIAELKVE